MLAAAPRQENLDRRSTLRRRAEFVRCYESGRRWSGRFATLHALPNSEGRPRLGSTVSRKVGGAVVRHRLKRWIRESYRRWEGRGALPGLDLVVHVKPPAAAADFASFRAELLRQWSQLLDRRP